MYLFHFQINIVYRMFNLLWTDLNLININKSELEIQWKLLYVITLGQTENDNINWMIAIIGIYNTDTKYLSVGYLGLGQMGSFYHNSRMITRKAAYSVYFV